MYGKYTLLDKANPNVYAFTRILDNEKFLVVLNFSKKVLSFDAHKFVNYNEHQLVLSNYDTTKNMSQYILPLQPYEARVYKLSY